jgi:hypothetical protein
MRFGRFVGLAVVASSPQLAIRTIFGDIRSMRATAHTNQQLEKMSLGSGVPVPRLGCLAIKQKAALWEKM